MSIDYLFCTRLRILRIHSETILRAFSYTFSALNALHSMYFPLAFFSVYIDSVGRALSGTDSTKYTFVVLYDNASSHSFGPFFCHNRILESDRLFEHAL